MVSAPRYAEAFSFLRRSGHLLEMKRHLFKENRKQFAARLRISPSSLARYETTGIPKLEQVNRFAKRLGCQVADLTPSESAIASNNFERE